MLVEGSKVLREGDGAEGNRTPDLLLAKQPLSQLSYRPVFAAQQLTTLRRLPAFRCHSGGPGFGPVTGLKIAEGDRSSHPQPLSIPFLLYV